MNKVLIIILSLWSMPLFAAIDVYQFKDEDKQHRFQTLVAELRCPKCQNQTLADSNSEIATDLRLKVYQMLESDKTDAVIIDYMLARYGEFVLYKPRMSGQTFLLWYGPAILLLLGLIVIFLIIRQRRLQKKLTIVDKHTLDQTQQQTLDALLKINNGKK
ncbi:MAG: cytochrome c-type biogenesis protein CcmH [Methylococcales bacterium]|nr:cytochrome c-type biogenesis protein CcmH [Methylococcales bacterium]